jgi:hypothetical protein
LISAKIEYTFLSRYGILLRKNRRGGYHHENSFGLRSYLQRWSPYPGYLQWTDDLSPRSSGPEKDPYGYPGRTFSANGRGDLPAFSLQNQEILLRYPPFRLGKQDREALPSEEWSQDTSQENPRAGEKGNPTAAYYREGYVCHYSSPKRGRVLWEIQTSSPNLSRLWYKQKKITSQVAKERSLHLLTPESVEVLDSSLKPKKVEISRHSIQSDLQELLRKGFTTSCAGGFFFIPYLQELNIHSLLGELCPSKKEGIPPDRIALQLIFEALFGYTRGIRTVDPISQADFGGPLWSPFSLFPFYGIPLPYRYSYGKFRAVPDLSRQSPT